MHQVNQFPSRFEVKFEGVYVTHDFCKVMFSTYICIIIENNSTNNSTNNNRYQSRRFLDIFIQFIFDINKVEVIIISLNFMLEIDIFRSK